MSGHITNKERDETLILYANMKELTDHHQKTLVKAWHYLQSHRRSEISYYVDRLYDNNPRRFNEVLRMALDIWKTKKEIQNGTS